MNVQQQRGRERKRVEVVEEDLHASSRMRLPLEGGPWAWRGINHTKKSHETQKERYESRITNNKKAKTQAQSNASIVHLLSCLGQGQGTLAPVSTAAAGSPPLFKSAGRFRSSRPFPPRAQSPSRPPAPRPPGPRPGCLVGVGEKPREGPWQPQVANAGVRFDWLP